MTDTAAPIFSQSLSWQERIGYSWKHPVLFGLTILTTLVAGANMQGYVSIWPGTQGILAGLEFTIPLMIILGCHELGHYLVSRHYGVQASLPYFIPAPPFITFIGTFGAVISMRSRVPTRKAILEIGIAGPIASYVLSIAAIILGFALIPGSEYVQNRVAEIHHMMGIDSHPESGVQLSMGTSLAFAGLASLFGHSVPMHEIYHFPLIFAGWIGLLITALNLIPAGQLDGGHVLYALVGKYHQKIGYYILGAMILLGVFSLNWLVWAVLVYFIARRPHPPVIFPREPLEPRQVKLAWSGLFMLITTFIPIPFSL
ncbi:MAG: site-2 protease family protein [Lentisphaeria bacterium]|nr:site-2 protease family protein [Candidatus Neomarinimicrobiota bacterium]MCF7842479.1 site-2 protease family protein [Lentisphaeria bacterium]